MRTNIDLDDELMELGFSLTKARTKKELVHLALQELVRRRKAGSLYELSGKVRLSDGYDHKSMRTLRNVSD